MIYRRIFAASLSDSLFLLALSGAAYHHTGAIWLLYVIYFASVMTFGRLFTDVASWAKYLGDAIEFHGACIRDKTLHIRHDDTLVIRHSGQIRKS